MSGCLRRDDDGDGDDAMAGHYGGVGYRSID